MTGDFAPPPGARGPQEGSGADRAARAPVAQPADARSAGRAPNALRSGKGVRVAAWVAIGAGVALLIGISWSAALALSDREVASAEVGETGALHPLQVVPGMCLEEVGDDGSVAEVQVIPCDERHGAEVFTSMVLNVAKYPGDDEMQAEALETCRERLDGLLPEGSSWVAWAPSEASWARGDRTVLCVAAFDEPLREPLSPAGIEGMDEQGPRDDDQDA